MPFASSVIRYLTSFATSSGFTNRLCGIHSIISSFENSLSSIDDMPSSVSTQPGLIVFTVILNSASSNASAFVSPRSPAFPLFCEVLRFLSLTRAGQRLSRSSSNDERRFVMTVDVGSETIDYPSPIYKLTFIITSPAQNRI